MTGIRLIVVAAWTLLVAAWVVGNPALGAPDERDHYVRALAVASGQVVGEPAPEAAGGKTARQLDWTRQATRRVQARRDLLPPPDSCYVLDPGQAASCIANTPGPAAGGPTTPVGTYQPLPYLLAGPATTLAGSPLAAVRAARVPGAIVAVLLFACALLSVRSVSSLLGLIVAVTPMALFCAASISGSGLEIASGVAFSAVAIRLARDRGSPAWLWLLLAVSGAVLALSRSPGPAWVVVILLLALALAGPRGCWERIRTGRVTAGLSLGVLLAASVANRAWELRYGPSLEPVTDSLGYGARLAVEQWWNAAPELVGRFGYLEFSLPAWIPLAWLLALAGLFVLAWRASGSRERLVLAGTTAVAIVLPLLVFLVVTRQTGFGLQGRHVLPVLVALPILVGELLPRSGRAVSVGAAATGLVAGACQFAAFWENGRRAAVGVDGPLWFPASAQWAPPGGWTLSIALAALGSAALVAAGALIARRAEPPERRAGPAGAGQGAVPA